MEWTQFSLYKNGFLRSRVKKKKRTSHRKYNNKERKEHKKFLYSLSTHPKHLFIRLENQNINYS